MSGHNAYAKTPSQATILTKDEKQKNIFKALVQGMP
jgi:hypothetical protein